VNNKAEVETLKTLTKDELFVFIRDELKFDDIVYNSTRKSSIENDHLRFDMSGYEDKTGQCTIDNQIILNKFAYLGIYDHTNYLFLDFYKGIGTLYFQYFGGGENYSVDLSGYGTTEIIYDVFKKTIFSGKPKRRR
jgi:hypothetical protein